MATTKIWDVNSRLERLIDYASNPEKTENKTDMDYHYNGLGQTLSYTTNDLRTEKQLYVSGINCSYATALEDMMLTKKLLIRWMVYSPFMRSNLLILEK